MQRLRRELFVGVPTVLGTMWLLVVAWLWLIQERLIFLVPMGVDVAALEQVGVAAGMTPVHLTAADGVRLYGWRRDPPGPARCAVLHLQGQGGTIADSLPLADTVSAAGCGFFVLAYRGYPGSEGSPSEAGLGLDARAAWELLSHDLPAAHLAIHGFSMGGGVAVGLATEVHPAALIVESSFTSLLDVAAGRYPFAPVRTLGRVVFPSLARAPGIDVPVLELHGDADRVIPVAHGRRLHTAFPHARYVEVPGGGHHYLTTHEPAANAAYTELLTWLQAEVRPPTPF